jgi:predicted ATPase
MRLRVLGGLELVGAPSPGPKPLFLLAYLALEGAKERRFLAELLWHGTTDPRNRLSTALSRLRRIDPDLIQADATRVSTGVACDAATFLEAWRDGRWEEAAAAYGGPFLDGFDPAGSLEVEEWLYATREAMARRLLGAVVELGEHALQRGDLASARRRAEEAQRQLATAGPDDETIPRLYALLAATGSPATAAVAEEAEALGIDLPDPARLADGFGDRGDRSLAGRALPPEPGPLFGREAVTERLVELLAGADARCVTVTGPAGVGKTRLALHVAHVLAARGTFRDGVAFVSLAEVTAADEALPFVANALRIRSSGPRPAWDALAERLQESEALLVLDNLEHVASAAPRFGALLAACPGLRLLGTSRSPLRVAGERRLPLEPLAVPSAGEDAASSPAVALFVARARDVDPDFALDETHLGDVAELCARLDGLPLALELAAARVRLLEPREMLARLDARFEILSLGSRDADPRHATLRAALDWSHELLDEDRRVAFRRFAAFAGPVPLAAFEAVAGDLPAPLDALGALVDDSLVRVHAGPPRTFSMLETVRAYARDRLREAGEARAAEEARAAYLLALAEEAAGELTGPRQTAWLERLAALRADLTAATTWATTEGDPDTALRFVAALWRWWIAHNLMREGRRDLQRAVERAPAGPPTRPWAEALEGLGILLQELGEPAQARERLRQAQAAWTALDDHDRVAATRNHLAWCAANLGELDEADDHARTALEHHRRRRDPRGEAVSLNNLGWAAMYRGDPAAAREHFAAGLALRERAQDERGVAFARTNLAWALRAAGDLEAAARLSHDAAVTLERLGDDQVLSWTRIQQSAAALDGGSVDEAEHLARDALARIDRVGSTSGRSLARTMLASVRLAQGRGGEAAALAEHALSLAAEIDERWTQAEAAQALARARLAGGRTEGACEALRTALTLRWSMGDVGGSVDVLGIWAAAYRAAGRDDDADRLLAAAGTGDRARLGTSVTDLLRAAEG